MRVFPTLPTNGVHESAMTLVAPAHGSASPLHGSDGVYYWGVRERIPAGTVNIIDELLVSPHPPVFTLTNMPFLRIEDQDLYYRWNPAADGPVLLFIHGLGSSNSFYDPIIPSLVQKGFSCLAFDTPGSALSKYRGRDSDVDALCGAATALIASLDLDSTRVIVIGHSMGGIVASELALHMELLGVVLLGPVLPSSAVADAFATRIKTVTAEGMEPIANMIPSAATGSNSTLTQKAFIRALLLAQAPEGYVSLCKTIAGATPPRYSGIKCPMLLVAGSDDKTASMESSQKILESWGDSRKELKVLDGVGHWHCIEAAGEVGALIDAFAAGLGSTNRT